MPNAFCLIDFVAKCNNLQFKVHLKKVLTFLLPIVSERNKLQKVPIFKRSDKEILIWIKQFIFCELCSHDKVPKEDEYSDLKKQ